MTFLLIRKVPNAGYERLAGGQFARWKGSGYGFNCVAQFLPIRHLENVTVWISNKDQVPNLLFCNGVFFAQTPSIPESYSDQLTNGNYFYSVPT